MRTPSESKKSPFVIGTRWTLTSSILGEDRSILVRVPNGYDGGTQSYPVLYLLDGEDVLFHSSSGVVAHLSEWESHLPEMVIVGISNTNRTRDMLPTKVVLPNGRQHGGGADTFLDFVGRELIPFMEDTHRVGNYRMLCGTSASALTVVYEYLTQRIGFSAYLASSPTLDWDARLAFRMLEDVPADELPTDAPLSMFAGGQDLRSIASDCAAFDEALRARDTGSSRVNLRMYEDAGHCPFEGFRDGLLWLLKDWSVTDASVETGIDAVGEHYERLQQAHGFNISARCYDDLAHRWASRGRLDEALQWLERGRSVYPMSADIAFAQALCLIRNKQEDDARRLLDDAAAAGLVDARLLQLHARINPPLQDTAS